MNTIVKELIKNLEYALKCKDEELLVEFNISGFNYEEIERKDLTEDENPLGMFNKEALDDGVELSGAVFSTTDILGGSDVSFEEIKEFLNFLKTYER